MPKTILITGAGTGIGRDAAFALTARGHHVLATTHTEVQAAALRADCAERQLAVEVFKLDITEPDDRAGLRVHAVDVLINNAAIADTGSLAEVDVQRIRDTFEVNLFSTLALTQVALEGMIQRQKGTVLFVSSLAGRVPLPFLMPYAMTKFALSAAGAALRAEMDQLGKNIQIALVEPGAFDTGFNQAMSERKYSWMATRSYFAEQATAMRKREQRELRWVQARSTASIVNQIIKAAEARRPRLRYVAPRFQGIAVQLARMLGA